MGRSTLWLLLVTLAILAGSCKRKAKTDADPMLAFKRLDELPTFKLKLSKMASKSLAEKPREWVKATFRYKGKSYDDVGVRLKGHRSMRKFADKPALKIRFDKYEKGVRFKGKKRLTLNNMVEDPTMLREVLGYRLYRQLGVPAPAAFYAHVQVNGEDYGLYAVIETVDKDFLKERFGDASGDLFEGEYGCDLYVGDVDGFDRDSGGKDNSRAELRAFATAANGDAKVLFSDAGPIDMKSFLAYLAVSAFIGDFDGYRHAHNYRIYFEPTLRKWFFIPWGIDRSFKKQLSIYESFGLLARRCFKDAKCRADYVRVQRDVARAFEKLKLETGAEALAAFIEPVLAIPNDRNRSGKSINRARKGLLEFLRERPDSIATETACIDTTGSEVDGDGDGFGCLDCDDSNAAVHPGAVELCDGVDNDCSGAVDDSAECPSCVSVEEGGKRFALCDFPRPWVEARDYCRSLGGELAVIGSSTANEALAKAAKEISDGRWWIGLNDRDLEGRFVGGSPDYANWAKSEPDNHTCNQDCAVIDTKRKGRWHDTHCGQFAPFVCSLEGAGP